MSYIANFDRVGCRQFLHFHHSIELNQLVYDSLMLPKSKDYLLANIIAKLVRQGINFFEDFKIFSKALSWPRWYDYRDLSLKFAQLRWIKLNMFARWSSYVCQIYLVNFLSSDIASKYRYYVREQKGKKTIWRKKYFSLKVKDFILPLHTHTKKFTSA